MSVSRTGRRSAAYFLLFLAIAFLIGGILITVINPFWDGLESSPFMTFGTTWWSDFADWAATIHNWIGLIILIAILYTGFIRTRDPV